MSLKHTPGPWEIDDLNIYSKLKRWICDLPWLPNLNDEAGKANARLIAAAPEMLQIIIELLKDCINQYPPIRKKTWQQYYKDEISVIEKATGKKIDEVIK